jgi:FkbM family methyltransferase
MPLLGGPIGFIDVGARGWVHPLIDPLAPAMAVLGFEPDQAECERMNADPELRGRYARMELVPVALAEQDGPATLHEIIAPTNTSLRSPNPVFVSRYDMVKWREVGQTQITTTTLDRVLFESRADEPFWGEALKIDTQGTEHEILLGARRTLTERTLFACIEVSFCELYVGQKLFSEIELLMREFGMSFYGFDNNSTRSRRALDKRRYAGKERGFQADAYFFKDPFDPANVGRPVTRRQRAILATFALLSGYHDFALELVDGAGEDFEPLRAEMLAKAALPAQKGREDARSLLDAIEARPEDANVLVGKFVDRRRAFNDYNDVVLPDAG